MNQPQFARRTLAVLITAGLGTLACDTLAAPTVSRLTPPSELFASGNSKPPYIARFLPGQKFDLQATVKADAGTTITGFQFLVDGAPCPATVCVAGTTSIVSGPAVTVSNGYVVSQRGYSNATAGVHTLTVNATQSDGQTVSATGNFEVVGTTTQGRRVKNIIILVGDGMGAPHRTAARIMSQGYAQGKAKGRLAMDTFPYTGMVMTSSLNSIVTDSAPGMATYVTGNKMNNNQEGVFPDDTSAPFDNPRVEYLSEYLHRTKGTRLGIVTTADVFDATPAAMAVHTADRSKGTGINDQFLDDRNLTGLTVLMGGGRKWYLPNDTTQSAGTDPSGHTFNEWPPRLGSTANGSARANASDYELPIDIQRGWGAAAGALDASRDLISDFQGAGFTYVSDNYALAHLDTASTKLLGLFTLSNMNVALDKINGRRLPTPHTPPAVVDDYGFPDQPLLEEMADVALKVLNKNNSNGFVLLVEGASIDKQAHLMDSSRWVEDTIELDHAVQKAKDFAAQNPDTLVIVTADHECAGASIIGASLKNAADLQSIAQNGPHTTAGQRDAVVGTYDTAKFPAYTIAADGYPVTADIDYKMLIGYGANADRYETWLTNAKPTQDNQQPFYTATPLSDYPRNPNVRNSDNGLFVTGQVPGEQAVHTATDIPLSAYGRGAYLFTGVMDNSEVFFKLGQAVLGGALQ